MMSRRTKPYGAAEFVCVADEHWQPLWIAVADIRRFRANEDGGTDIVTSAEVIHVMGSPNDLAEAICAAGCRRG